jgi:tape measure domain-containing protein
MIVGDLVAKFSVDSKEFTEGMKKAQATVRNTTNSMKLSLPVIRNYAAGIAALGATFTFTALRAATMIARVESIQRKLAVSAGGAEKTARAWRFLRQTSDELGLSLEDLAGNYGSLAAAAMGSEMASEDLESIFTAISQKAAILGMESHRVRLTFLAIEQMASKGVIAMEELRRQFGENVPGALAIMARSLNISTAELNAWVKTGKLSSEKVLPLLADQMRRENAPALIELADTMQRSIAKMKTSWFDLKKTAADGVIKDMTAGTIEIGAAAIDAATVTIKETEKIGSTLKDWANWWTKFLGTDEGEALSTLGVDTKKLLDTVREADRIAEKALFPEEERLKRIEEIRKEIFGTGKQSMEEWEETMTDTLASAMSEFTRFIVGLATGADVSFSKMLNSMAAKILDFTTTLLFVQPILDKFAFWMKSTPVDMAAGKAGSISGVIFSAFSSFFKRPTVKAMASGGVITEPVLGVGANSGSGYLMGEAGSEAIIPTDMLDSLGRGESVTVNIQAVDSKSISELMRSNPQAVVGPIVEAIKSGDRGLSSSLRMAVG